MIVALTQNITGCRDEDLRGELMAVEQDMNCAFHNLILIQDARLDSSDLLKEPFLSFCPVYDEFLSEKGV